MNQWHLPYTVASELVIDSKVNAINVIGMRQEANKTPDDESGAVVGTMNLYCSSLGFQLDTSSKTTHPVTALTNRVRVQSNIFPTIRC
jgi:hypothetical protein